MKKLVLLFAGILFGCFAFAQAPRLVLLEEFTQASCPPCAAQNPDFNILINANLDKVVAIKYQVWWPGFDPMYEQTASDIDVRVPYYGVTGAPNALMDGVLFANDCGAFEGAPACLEQQEIDDRAAVTSPLEVTVTHSVNPNFKQMDITVTIKNVSAADIAAGKTLQTVLVEDLLNFPEPPGTNGELEFSGVMRKMYPDADGTKLPAIAAGATITETMTVDIPEYIYILGEMAIVAFVQDDTNQEVLQAAYSSKIAQPTLGDISALGNSDLPSGLCDYSLTPVVEITNEGTVAITSAEVVASLNGSVLETKTYSGNLAAGQNATITFASATLADAGQYNVSYALTKVNGQPDGNNLNNLIPSESFSLVAEDAVGNSVLEDMESTTGGELPAQTVLQGRSEIFVADVDFMANVTTQVTTKYGAFLQSDKSLCALLWVIPDGEETSLIWGKLNLSQATGGKIYFDRAYRQYSSGAAAEQDQLLIEASTDCGATWVELFNKAGNDLKTGTPTTTFFVPKTASVWKKDSADLAPVAGASEALVRFRVVSNFGNNMYLDNINVGTASVGTFDPTLDQASTVYPTPANEFVNVRLNLQEASELTVTITDPMGRVVGTVAQNRQFSAGVTELTYNNLPASGVYFVRIQGEKGEASKRFTVVR